MALPCTRARARVHTSTRACARTHTHTQATHWHTHARHGQEWMSPCALPGTCPRSRSRTLPDALWRIRRRTRGHTHTHTHTRTQQRRTCTRAHTCAHARAAPLPPSFPRPELSDGALRAHAPLRALKARGVQKCARTRAHACVRACACVLRVCTCVCACSAWERTRARCGRRESARASGRHERATWHAVGLAAVVHHEAERRVHGRVALVPVRARKRGGGPERTTQCV